MGKPTAWEKPSNQICGQVGEVETSSQVTGRNRRLGGEWVTVLPRVLLACCVRNMGRNTRWNKGHAMESNSSWMLPSFLGFDESLGRKETAFLLFLNFIAIAAVATFIQKKPSSVRWRSFGENSSLGLE